MREYVLICRSTLATDTFFKKIIADFENQGAHRLAKQYDPDGKRTIGKVPTLCIHLSLLTLLQGF